MTQSKRGILTSSQQEYLAEGAEFEKYKKRSDIRKHIHSALLDGEVLFDNLPEEDREQVFDPRKAPQAEYIHPTDEGGKDKGEVGNSVDIAMELDELERNIAALIALVYEGLEKYTVRERQHTDNTERYGRPFDEIIGTAMNKVANRNGWYLEEFEFTAKFDKSGHSDRLEALESGEAGKDEAIALLQQGEISKEQFDEYYESLF